MTKLSDIAKKIRSKNAGPFWLTIDVFCDTAEAYQKVVNTLDVTRLADVLQADPATLKRFEISDLNVVKISIPRPAIQGTRQDRDMHGASFANILAELEV
ncbi:DUF4387 domain-containing protein [Cognatishimia activa]|uniref:DUF4387 domain-containing protein n=1 Tax=Cognatishimia activa TaxID=1715691 RepID=UPI00222EC09A|nr:DUF4387 domain-containing protein [Cognatishimia activa]UZD90405.1 DUF4387 domain-containing protein [Cognatishimia activa]